MRDKLVIVVFVAVFKFPKHITCALELQSLERATSQLRRVGLSLAEPWTRNRTGTGAWNQNRELKQPGQLCLKDKPVSNPSRDWGKCTLAPFKSSVLIGWFCQRWPLDNFQTELAIERQKFQTAALRWLWACQMMHQPMSSTWCKIQEDCWKMIVCSSQALIWGKCMFCLCCPRNLNHTEVNFPTRVCLLFSKWLCL